MADEDENIMSILVASDVHVGYKEKDGERGKDSFVSLEEIFIIAKEKNVDFILLGGDLFHDNKPSRKTLHWTMELFRKYCLGDRPCQVEVVSDQAVNFGHTSSSITCVNYENPNMNIGMPVFSIHGNHDDPTGAGELSAIDYLSVAGLLNHFGKQTTLDKIDISPVLMQKGTTRLALYGLGSTRDERLHRLFLNKKITFYRPKEAINDWFNMFVLHQNRSKHGTTNYIPEQFIDEFFDLVVWGHEHECRIKPEWNNIKNFCVMQPGSPVATSLCEGEAKPKKVAVLRIRGREMNTEIIPLKTVRQLYVENIVLANCIPKRNFSPKQLDEAAIKYCNELVEDILIRAEDERSGHPKQPTKPLIRLRVDYSGGFDVFNAPRFGAKFADRVGNPENIVHFLKKSVKRENSVFDVRDMDDMIGPEVVQKVKIEDLVQEYLNTKEKKEQMKLLTAQGVSGAVSEFVDKHEKDAIRDLCDHQINKTKEHITEKENSHDITMELDDIIEEVSRYHDERESILQEQSSLNASVQKTEIQNIIKNAKEGRLARGEPTRSTSDDENVIDDVEIPNITSMRGKRGSSKTRGASRGRGSRGGRGKKTTTAPINDSFFGKGKDIMSAFQRLSQSSSSQLNKGSESFSRQPVATSAAKTSSKRGRGKGVVYVLSSDEEDSLPAVAKRSRLDPF